MKLKNPKVRWCDHFLNANWKAPFQGPDRCHPLPAISGKGRSFQSLPKTRFVFFFLQIIWIPFMTFSTISGVCVEKEGNRQAGFCWGIPLFRKCEAVGLLAVLPFRWRMPIVFCSFHQRYHHSATFQRVRVLVDAVDERGRASRPHQHHHYQWME